MKQNRISYGGLAPFDFKINNYEITSSSPLNEHNDHIHNECEIYINLGGDVSFSVENSVYPVMPGNIIITRPGERHHCVYHSARLHSHFWILFQADGNEHLLDIFYNREAGRRNLLIPDPGDGKRILALCRNMSDKKLNEAEKYYYFFELIYLLGRAAFVNAPQKEENGFMPKAVNYINDRITEPVKVADIAEFCSVSINTLERHFEKLFGTSPSEYIKRKRLANATRLLSDGYSITDAAEQSGFSDVSRFIGLFKKTYGITPLKYKKSREADR